MGNGQHFVVILAQHTAKLLVSFGVERINILRGEGRGISICRYVSIFLHIFVCLSLA